MKRTVITACLLIIAVCTLLLWKGEQTLFPPSHPAQSPHKIKVALSQAEPLTPWKTAQINSFQVAAKGSSLDFIYHSPQEETLAWQLQDIEALFNEGIDYLILIPLSQTGYDSVLLEARERNIPVILAEQTVKMDSQYHTNDYYLTYVAPDYFKEGEQCADILASHFGIQPCHTLVIQGDKQSSMSHERYLGFMHGIRMHPSLFVSKRMESNGERLTSQKVTEQALADPDITFNAVFAPSDEDGLGALQALKLAGSTPKRDAAIVSIGGIQDVVKAIIAEEYLATVKSSPDYGGLILDLIQRRENGETLERRIVLPNQVYTLKNAQEAFEDAY